MNNQFPYHSPAAFVRDVLITCTIGISGGLLVAFIADGILAPQRAQAACGWNNFKFGRLAQQYWMQERGVWIGNIVDASWQCGKGTACRQWVNAACRR